MSSRFSLNQLRYAQPASVEHLERRQVAFGIGTSLNTSFVERHLRMRFVVSARWNYGSCCGVRGVLTRRERLSSQSGALQVLKQGADSGELPSNRYGTEVRVIEASHPFANSAEINGERVGSARNSQVLTKLDKSAQ